MRSLSTPNLYAPQNKQHNFRFMLSVIFVYAAFVFFVSLNHEFWRDETYPWLMARDLSFSELVKELGYNISPGLWYFMLIIPAKAGLDPFVQQFLHWVIACVAVSVFLFRAPFTIIFKLIFISSCFILYQYSVVVRSYGLSILLMFGACALYPNRAVQPVRYCVVLALLANSNIYGLIAAFLFGSEFFIHCIKSKKFPLRIILSLAIVLFGGLFSAYCALPAHDSVPYFIHPALFNRVSLFPQFFITGFIGEEDLSVPLAVQILALPLLILPFYLFIRNRKFFALAFLVISWGFLTYFMLFKYMNPGIRHYGFYMIFLVTSLWLAYPLNKQPQLPEKIFYLFLYMFMLVGVVVSGKWIATDLDSKPLSGGKGMAETLKKIGYKNYNVMGDYNPLIPSVVIHMPKDFRFWYAEEDKWASFVHFTAQSRLQKPFMLGYRIAYQRFDGVKNVLFLLSYRLPDKCTNMILLGHSLGYIESFYLYKAKDPESNFYCQSQPYTLYQGP